MAETTGTRRYGDQDEQREFNLRCNPEGATHYDVNYLLARISRLETERADLGRQLRASSKNEVRWAKEAVDLREQVQRLEKRG